MLIPNLYLEETNLSQRIYHKMNFILATPLFPSKVMILKLMTYFVVEEVLFFLIRLYQRNLNHPH